MSERAAPSLTIVLVTPDDYETVRATVESLRLQTLREELEVIIVGPTGGDLGLDPVAAADFWRMHAVTLAAIESRGAAYAAGIRAASAPVAALGEDHSFPAPGWAEALLAAHRGPWAVVGPAVATANPGSLIAWADYLINYGPWRAPARSGVVEHLPGHNSSYKREILLEYGADLDWMLEGESVLHWDLRAKGHQLYLAGDATTAHLNFGRFSTWIAVAFYNGRLFAATRAEHWPRPRRWLYAGGSPLIPLVRFGRIVRSFRQPPGAPRRALPLVLLGLGVDGLGQCLGYAVGSGDTSPKLARLEFHRVRHLGKRRGHAPARG
ncbi:MAG: glycosyltransferase family 2 protein [Thermomicrobiales bacterium]